MIQDILATKFQIKYGIIGIKIDISDLFDWRVKVEVYKKKTILIYYLQFINHEKHTLVMQFVCLKVIDFVGTDV